MTSQIAAAYTTLTKEGGVAAPDVHDTDLFRRGLRALARQDGLAIRTHVRGTTVLAELPGFQPDLDDARRKMDAVL